MAKNVLLSPEDFGAVVHLTQRQVYHRIKLGQIKAAKYGWVHMIPESEVEAIRDTDWYRASKKTEPVPA